MFIEKEDHTAGEDAKGISLKVGDTLQATAYLSMYKGIAWGYYYTILYQGKPYFIETSDVFSITDKENKELLKITKTKFTIPSTEDKDTWARANFFASKNSSKIIIANEYFIETGTSGKQLLSYRISRLPLKDSVTYEVKAFFKTDELEDESKKAVLFIKNNIEY